MELTQYKDWAPTQFDHKGLSLDERQEWFVAPVSRTRDSGCLETSNFEVFQAILDEIDREQETWENHVFNHWGPGWFEIILVKPDSRAYNAALEAAKSLEDYPILDEMDLSEREFEAACIDWEHYGEQEFINKITPEDIELTDHEGISLDQFLNGLGGSYESSDEGTSFPYWEQDYPKAWEWFKENCGVEYEFIGEHEPVPIRQFFDSQAIAWFVGLNEDATEGNLVNERDEVIGRAFEQNNLWTIQNKDNTYNATGIDLYGLVEEMLR